VSSTAEEQNPQPAVEQFLTLHAALSRATVITDTLTKPTITSAASPDRSAASDAGTVVSTTDEEAAAVAAERRRRATSWVSAALATDLSAFGLYNLKPAPATVSSPLAVVVVDESSKPAAAAATPTKSSPSPKSRMSPAKGKARTGPGTTAAAAALTTTPAPPEWKRGGGAEERGELARRLREESRGWFLGFVERFLDADVAAATPWDRERAARMLPRGPRRCRGSRVGRAPAMEGVEAAGFGEAEEVGEGREAAAPPTLLGRARDLPEGRERRGRSSRCRRTRRLDLLGVDAPQQPRARV